MPIALRGGGERRGEGGRTRFMAGLWLNLCETAVVRAPSRSTKGRGSPSQSTEREEKV